MKKLATLLLGLLFIAGSFITQGAPVKYKVGINADSGRTWRYIKEQLAKENIDLEIVTFDSYRLPNAALNNKEIDLNGFQHYAFLNNEIKQFGYDIVPIAETVYAPLGLFSSKIKSLSELKDGARIIIPDDTTNGGRALRLLEKNGLITVDPKAGWTPTLKDITANPRKFEIIEIEAVNIPGSLPEVDLAAVNSGVARDAGIIGKHIVLESVEPGADNPYINVIAVRREDKDNEIAKRVVYWYHTDAVKEIIKEDSKGAQTPVW